MGWNTGSKAKYGNRKGNLDGIEFDSQKEAARWAELKYMEKAGLIKDLRRQVKYILIPAQHEISGGKVGKLLERECSYLADFVYTENGQEVVEDSKGFRTKEYIIKRKLMLERFGIRIREV